MLIAELILELTANSTGISVRQMKSDLKDKDIADARKMAVALMIEHKCNYTTIARHIKYSDRSGVSKAHDQHKMMMQQESDYYNYVVTFKRVQICTRRAIEMLINDTSMNVSQIVETITKKC